MKRSISMLCVCLISLQYSGCISARFEYPDPAVAMVQLHETPTVQKKVAVTPFVDERKMTNDLASAFMYMIPFNFKASMTYNRPETASEYNTIMDFNFSPEMDIGKAVHRSVQAARIFSVVDYAVAYDKASYDYILSGRIVSTKYTGDTYAYGLSVFGPLLWILGLPAGASHNEMGVVLELRSVAEDRIVWDSTIMNTSKITQGLYYHFGKDVDAYPRLLGEGMNDALTSLDAAMAGE